MSYSREDAEWLRRFETMLKPVVDNGGLELWSDARLVAGERWHPELSVAIERARAALLLVTESFLASSFIMEQELPALVQRGALLLPVLVDHCMWEQVDVLRELQWLHGSSEGPIADAPNPARPIVDVCRRLCELELLHAELAPQREVSPVPFVPALAAAAERSGAVDGVPSAPPGFVERSELGELRTALLGAGAGSVGITGGGALGLHGQGGIGKTVLAAALAQDADLRRHFPDGVYWVTVGERADLVAVQIDLLERLGAPTEGLRNATDGRARLRAALERRRCLVIVDDVWTGAATEAFAAAGPGSRVLYTTRDPGVLRAVHAEVREIGVLGPDSARDLLAHVAGTTAAELPADTDRILAATGRVPLALALAGAAVGRGGPSWRQVADQIDQAGETFLDHPYANTFKAIQVAVGALDGELRAAYESLVVYLEDTWIPLAAVQRWWAHQHGLPPERTRELLEQLADAKLLAFEHGAFAFHDLQREYLLLHADSVRVLHHDLVDAYRALLPSPDSPWRELPPDEPYIWEQLLEHLSAAGDTAGAKRVATDLGYLAMRSFRSGPHAAEADIRRAVALDPDDPVVGWVLRRIARWGHLLSGHERLGDLAATLVTRTATAPQGVDAHALHELLPARALQSRWGLDDPDALIRVLEAHSGWVRAVAFTPDGRTLASASSDGTVRLWDPASGAQTAVLERHPGGVRAVAFAPDGRTLASGGDDGMVRVWDPASGAQTAALEGHHDWVRGIAFALDGRTLASAGNDGTVRLWRPARGARSTVRDGHHDRVRAVAFAPDGRTLASAGDDGTVRLWDPAGGAQTAVLEGHQDCVRAVAFAPDGRTLASAGEDGTVRLWDPAGGAQTAVLEGHHDWVRGIAFAPDGRTLASASNDATIRLWNPASGAQTAVLEGHHDGVRAVAFAPDGRTLASAGNDATIRLWNPASGAQTAVLEGHHGGVRAVAFASDGRTLASAGNDGTVRLWDRSERTPTVSVRFGAPVAALALHGPSIAIGFDRAVAYLLIAGRSEMGEARRSA